MPIIYKGFYEFQLCQDTFEKIIRYPIIIRMKKKDWDVWDNAVRQNFMKDEPNKELMRDIAESFDCGWISIEHLTAIRNFISQGEEHTRDLLSTP